MEGKLKIAEQSQDGNFYNFTFDTGETCNVGKQSESNPNGAANYEEAIEILQMNFPDLIL